MSAMWSGQMRRDSTGDLWARTDDQPVPWQRITGFIEGEQQAAATDTEASAWEVVTNEALVDPAPLGQLRRDQEGELWVRTGITTGTPWMGTASLRWVSDATAANLKIVYTPEVAS